MRRKERIKFNPLDSMAWTIGVIGVLLGTAAVRLPYKASTGSVPEEAKNMRMAYSIALGATGFYLFINGLYISFTGALGTFVDHWPVLFGGAATLGGLIVVAAAVALYKNVSLSIVSYFAGIIGAYLAVDAFAILDYGLTRNPLLAALGYLSASGALWGSTIGINSDKKYLRWLFAVLAVIFAVAWLYQGANFTIGHLNPE